jgi:glucokinase
MGTPGTIDRERGTVAHAVNVPPLSRVDPVPLAALVSTALGGVRTLLENDVRAAVLGEWKRGAGRPYRDFLGVFVGTGVGGGIVLADELETGRGAAGEIGHTIVKRGGRRCGCGGRGHLESYAGRGQMELTARRWHHEGRKTKLFELMRRKGRDRVTSGVIASALEDGDEVAMELIDDAVWALGVALASTATLLDLEAVIIGGGLGDRLGAPFVERVAAEATPLLYQPERAPAFLGTELGDLSGAVGATVLAGG